MIADRRPDAAARTALSLYSDAPRGDQVHTWIRWLSCPFPGIEAELPASGRILEIGCGHGLFAAYAAISNTDREVHGVDIDADKIAVAQRAADRAQQHGAKLTVDVAPSGRVPAGPWDAIVIVDVLYLLPAEAQRALLLDAVSQLADDGVLLVKEMSLSPVWKARWNSLQESLSVRVLGITEGEQEFTFVPAREIASWLGEAGLRTEVRRLDRGRLHPHQLLRARW